MRVLINYKLSEMGRKASLLAGGDGKQCQTVEVERDTAEYAEVVAAGKLGSENCALDTTRAILDQGGGIDPTEWDAIPNVRQLLDDHARRLAEAATREAAFRAAKREETLAVLREKKTRDNYGTIVADWPQYAATDVKESPEAQAWLAEIAEANAARKAAETKAREEKAAADKVEAEAKAAAEAARREALGLRDGDRDFRIEDGALTRVPCWESHSRGKNWMAVIGVNPSAPGGLDRSFAPKAKGDCYYIVPSLEVGDAVEFGGDYYSGRGRPSRERWYGYVVRVDAAMLVLHDCGTGKAAIKEGKAFAASGVAAAVAADKRIVTFKEEEECAAVNS